MIQKLGLAINVKELKPRPHHLKNYYEIAERADEAGLYYLGFPNMVSKGVPGIETFTYMTSIAMRTQNIKLGTDVWQLPLYHPIKVALTGATVDIISGGRFICGAGAGTIPIEFENLGVPFNERGKRFNETIEIVKKLWTEPIVTYHGKFFNLKDVVCIKPIQEPHPPIWIGGGSDAALRRAVKHGNAWAGATWPFFGSGEVERFSVKDCIEKLKEYCKQFGRDPETVGVNLRIHMNINTNREKAVEDVVKHFDVHRKRRVGGGGTAEQQIKWAVLGPAEAVIEKVKETYKLGADLVILWPMTTDLKSQWERIEKEIIPSM
ncbi:MAG: LLM class flavin-dependent oxidoreductase [Hadesarchaea archaeon]|nr:LLM class flavin-dependent oxidoreductase [Hadesarchaea archaeon]